MVVRIHPWRITWRFLVVFAILLAVTFLACVSLFFGVDSGSSVYVKPYSTSHTLFIIIFATLFVSTYVMSMLGQSYVIEDKYFAVRRLKKEFVYDYASIIFIDFEASKRKKMVILYTKKSGMKYMLGDKDGKLLETLQKKCPSVMSVSEFRRTYPQARY